MLVINCKGTPREIGLEHGTKAATHIRAGIQCYQTQFMEMSNVGWEEVLRISKRFEPAMRERYPWLMEEIEAIAEGAGVSYLEIMALNFRQEIIFGMYADGCTSLGWKTSEKSFLSQNWDWLIDQKDNVIVLNIDAPGKPRISMGTEAGIIGKIGLNSDGVGVCANGIRAKGVDYNGTPVHICRRLVLESQTRDEAIAKIEKYGTAAAGHMLVGDATGCIGLECTIQGIKKLYPDSKGRIMHTNHLLAEHEGVVDYQWLEDSPRRLRRLTELANELGRNPTQVEISELFKDESDLPCAINRIPSKEEPMETLFNIVMDLTTATAVLKFGRPTQPDDVLILAP
ncbi:isopenicillin N acyltransferase [Dacryopinax primogenitus]|uniref:Isopenicillin N acyltransferase n=1 Tax=Dacryopinax primogenitus (strain DJM 731) TaxID=1858805 RepID=M5FR81_DACPD|nr:isopenicillin N acyltransferase [Dacryopinax primogenitus]EJT99595.1 isopenicillin N acyltransferase [Dacryopinax primogenitus]